MNISPWSVEYKKLHKGLDLFGFNNVSLRTSPFDGTWSLFSFPYLSTHIDHVWTNKPTRIRTIQTINIP